MTDPDIAKLAAEMRARAKRVGPLGYIRVTSDDILALLDALDARGREIEGRNQVARFDTRHQFAPHRKYPWFCKHCGYGRSEELQHNAPPADEPGGAR